eukprot:COSAG01_NODE_9333_length_2481_cov_2.599076_3_plen_269_part_00
MGHTGAGGEQRSHDVKVAAGGMPESAAAATERKRRCVQVDESFEFWLQAGASVEACTLRVSAWVKAGGAFRTLPGRSDRLLGEVLLPLREVFGSSWDARLGGEWALRDDAGRRGGGGGKGRRDRGVGGGGGGGGGDGTALLSHTVRRGGGVRIILCAAFALLVFGREIVLYACVHSMQTRRGGSLKVSAAEIGVPRAPGSMHPIYRVGAREGGAAAALQARCARCAGAGAVTAGAGHTPPPRGRGRRRRRRRYGQPSATCESRRRAGE